MTQGKIVVRIPPSPTGNLHIGTARTALFNYLFAAKYGGEVVLRIEDTDKERSKKEFEENIIESLNWLGIKYDGEVTRQSERTEKYKEALGKLIKKDAAYISKETSKNDPNVEVSV
ncbi:MAG: glutamate--tRNA ligase family protein, partial [Candidatus Zambryskibacteria bacterium]|nr:glutamate--tRNA ligase family protein [Candidatus Zambryskibacteria bacterium]